MRPVNKTPLFILLLLASSFVVAQNYRDRDQGYDRDRYEYCRDRARDISGYRGNGPSNYQRGKPLEGALKGAASASGLSWITGGNSKDRKKAAKRGAALGFLIGAAKQGKANKRRKENDRKRRLYKYELDECMDSNY